MDVEKLLRNPRFRWEVGSAPDPAALEKFSESAPENLPRTYLRFLKACNGGTGEVPYDSGHITLWPVESALRENAEHGLPEALPGFFAFGCDDKDHLFAFDLRAPDGAAVVSIPAKSIDASAVETLTGSFSEFLDHAVNMGGHA